MKRIILLSCALLYCAMTFTAFKTADDAQVIAIVNKAAWCSICKAYAGRTVETFNENNKDNYFQFIVNDITNEETKKVSKPAIVKAGLDKSLETSIAAGVLSFYNAKTKALVAQVTVANAPEEIAATMKMIREKVSN